VAAERRRAGRSVFAWERVTGRRLAAVSYALCLAAILDEMRERCLEPKAVYAAAAGATGAGLALGKAVLGWQGQVRLLCPIRWPWDTPADLANVANASAQLLGLPHRLEAKDIDVRTDYIGPGYGSVTPGGREAMALLARTEGILLDPVYTAKAMAGLIDDIRKNRLVASDPAVFIHTGGTPAVFAYRDEVMVK